jgi:hypothetical protein
MQAGRAGNAAQSDGSRAHITWTECITNWLKQSTQRDTHKGHVSCGLPAAKLITLQNLVLYFLCAVTFSILQHKHLAH